MNRLKFKLFGEIGVCYETDLQTKKQYNDVVSAKMWSMLTYLVIHKDSKISADDLTEILWANKEIVSPANSLKALLFKIRTLFSELGIKNPKKFLTCANGCFYFSNDIEIASDVDEFNALYKNLMKQNSGFTSLDICKIKMIYSGNLLIQLQSQPWVESLSNIYHTQFVNLCSHVLESLIKEERYNEAIGLCIYSTVIEPYNEFMQKCLLLSYVKTGHSHSAIKHYKYIKKLFLQYLGEVPSSTITDLYPVIVDSITPESSDIYGLREELDEESTDGAFFCEFATFKEIYRVSARNLKRNKAVSALGAIVIKNYSKTDVSKRCGEIAELQSFIADNLRIGDVFTRPSGDKFLILLNDTNSTNADDILKRIVKGYRHKSRTPFDISFTSITEKAEKETGLHRVTQ